jgi:hypothetical protein
MSNNKKSRWFTVTNWNLNCDYKKLVDNGQIRYIGFGLETCPTTKKMHHQAFVYFHNPKAVGKKSLNKIGSLFGDKHSHVEVLRGAISENEAYCSKEGTLSEFGDKPSQGKRGDLEETKTEILEKGLTVDEIAVADPHMFHMYGRTLERIETIALRKKFRNWMTEGIWYWGPTGVGKSHRAFADFNPATHYVKNLNEDFWNGYKGQPIVIMNEFRGQVSFSELLDLVDKYPKNVKWKCTEGVPFLARKLIITSSKEPYDIYYNALSEDESIEQLKRRFTIIKCEQKYSEGNNGNL